MGKEIDPLAKCYMNGPEVEMLARSIEGSAIGESKGTRSFFRITFLRSLSAVLSNIVNSK